MGKLALVVLLVCAGASAATMKDMKVNKTMDMKMHMKTMDADNDGMISKDEFMKYHEMMFDKMKKNQSGMVDLKDMEMMHHNMETMHKGKAKGKDGMNEKETK